MYTSTERILKAATPIIAIVGFEDDQLAMFAACNFKDRFMVPFTKVTTALKQLKTRFGLGPTPLLQPG